MSELVDSLNVLAVVFATVEEFLEYYDEARAGCLITEMCMCAMNGVELLERLVERGSALPTIVVTARTDVQLTVRAMRAGAITVLEKPCCSSELWQNVQEALRKDADNREWELRQRGVRRRLKSLSEEERQVMALMMAGKSNKVIANELVMGLRTVELRRHHLYRKMGVDSLAQLMERVIGAR